MGKKILITISLMALLLFSGCGINKSMEDTRNSRDSFCIEKGFEFGSIDSWESTYNCHGENGSKSFNLKIVDNWRVTNN